MKPILYLLPLMLLSACSPADNDPGPGGVTVGEARALDEAAEMIEAKRLPAQSQDTENDAAGTDNPGE